MSKRRLRAGFVGRFSYADGLELQERARTRLLESRAAPGAASREETLLLLEHPHVYTLGRNARAVDVKATADWLARHGVEVHETDRGGQVTYHGPGQLVGYPIVDLDPDRRDLRRYVRDLQQVLIAGLAELGIEAFSGEDAAAIGIWVEGAGGREKIASIGVHVKRWITTHGFALNVTSDLSMFGGIVACGLPGVTMTSIAQQLGSAPGLTEVASIVAARFARVFDRELLPLDRADATSWLRPPASAASSSAAGPPVR
ncbi:MAG TPA: lipoyl(octanoyl) transferase LipB [Thermoanaerobaculia bacterium]|nr:lipoyl(octanoyl) transferase LipB [Thermoanaerobaculia bacterium]